MKFSWLVCFVFLDLGLTLALVAVFDLFSVYLSLCLSVWIFSFVFPALDWTWWLVDCGGWLI